MLVCVLSTIIVYETSVSYIRFLIYSGLLSLIEISQGRVLDLERCICTRKPRLASHSTVRSPTLSLHPVIRSVSELMSHTLGCASSTVHDSCAQPTVDGDDDPAAASVLARSIVLGRARGALMKQCQSPLSCSGLSSILSEEL